MSVRNALLGIEDSDGTPEIRHVSLWNRNVEFIGQDEPWERPAVFLEFGPIDWQHARPAPDEKCSMHCASELLLHVVTDCASGCATVASSELSSMRLLSLIKHWLTGLSGGSFSGLIPVRELSNHDHGELLEEIVVLRYRGFEHF